MPSTEMPKYLEVSKEIEARISAGRWRGDQRMPAVREIADEYKVSVATASRALQVLRDKGIITSVERSGSYLVDGVEKSGHPWALCFCVTPGPWQNASYSITLSGFEALARREGFSFAADAINLENAITSRDIARQVKHAIGAGIKGLFFLPSRISVESMERDRMLLAHCRDAGLPVVLIERNLRGDSRELECDLVGPDDVGGGQRLAEHLQEIGRRKIAFVRGCSTSSHNDRLAGYLFAQFKGGDTDSPDARPRAPHVLEFRHDLPGKKAYSLLADQIVEDGIDGIICFQDITAIGLIVELLARGRRIPHDVAVAGFDDLPIGNSFSVGVTTYALDAERIAQHALRMMYERIKKPRTPPVHVVVPGRLIVRESTCASPSAGE
ncbi:LacI family DNA-binding transcriptional regulator [Singulisphaera sp. PoT]|uniref:LacI family DNA-binding transcriptional regulator n=1 Tax=Singulisphaera sp. PoT TaxID=3411797 RepID=UPI003BF58BE1